MSSVASNGASIPSTVATLAADMSRPVPNGGDAQASRQAASPGDRAQLAGPVLAVEAVLSDDSYASRATAMQALRDHGHVQPGQRVLVVARLGPSAPSQSSLRLHSAPQ